MTLLPLQVVVNWPVVTILLRVARRQTDTACREPRRPSTSAQFLAMRSVCFHTTHAANVRKRLNAINAGWKDACGFYLSDAEDLRENLTVPSHGEG